jgi:hypothetical protein
VKFVLFCESFLLDFLLPFFAFEHAQPILALF